jgi:hypothetical protein
MVRGLGVVYFSKVLARMFVVVWTWPIRASSFLFGSHSTSVLTTSFFLVLLSAEPSSLTLLFLPLTNFSMAERLGTFFKL